MFEESVLYGRVITFDEVHHPDLAHMPGLNANERAIARTLDKIDTRILRNGFKFLNPSQLQVATFTQQSNAFQNALNRAFALEAANPFGPNPFANLPPVPIFPKQAFDRLVDLDDAYEMAAYGKKDAGILSQSLVLLLPLNGPRPPIAGAAHGHAFARFGLCQRAISRSGRKARADSRRRFRAETASLYGQGNLW
jgi:hypothetical protein